jgi:hypothetical protein
VLWYDVASPMTSVGGLGFARERNQRLRALQPDIIINDRSVSADEDFGTPEGHVIRRRARLGSLHDLQRHFLGLCG